MLSVLTEKNIFIPYVAYYLISISLFDGAGKLSENKLNSILYIILAAVVVLYLFFNVFNVKLPAMALNGEFAEESQREVETKVAESMEAELKEVESSAEMLEKNDADMRNIYTEGYHLYVDLDLTQMYVYKDAELIKTYEVSGGKASSPSPVGTWKIINKDTWGEGFGGAWLGFNVPWGMYGIHGTTEPWSVGNSNISKGCIRMKNTDVRELYKIVPYNTVVTIVYKNRPFYPMRDGDVGSDVLEVEKALKKLGYYNGSEDGIFGDVVRTAVKEFQKDNRLYRTGVVNISTYEQIMQMVKEMEE